jgi:diguanylate cyclase (GGDEF)-like protein
MNPRRVLLAIALSLAAAAAASERGLPLIRVFPPEEYRAGSQNFAIAQDQRGVLYFGNLQGVLTYDGAWWRELALPNDSAAFAVATDEAGHVLAGGVGQLGLVERGATGAMHYRSLVPLMPASARPIGDVVSICRADHGLFITTDRYVLAWAGGAPRVIAETRGNRPRCYRVDGTTYIGEHELNRFDGERIVPFAPALDGMPIAAVASGGPGRVIAAVRTGGLFAIEKGAVTPFASEASAWLKGRVTTDAARVFDGRLVITTREDGIAIITPDGALEQIIDHHANLPYDVQRSAFVDQQGLLWLGNDGGIVQIDLMSPISIWDGRVDLHGTTYAMMRTPEHLYFATTQGLSAIDRNATHVRRLASIGNSSAWDLLRVDDGILVFTSAGIFHLDEQERVAPLEGTDRLVAYGALRPSFDREHVWLATRAGLAVLRRNTNGRWELDRMIAGSPQHVRRLVEENGVLWASTTFNGFVRIENAGTPHPQLTSFGTGEVDVFRIAGRLAFLINSKIFRWVGRKMVLDPVISRLHTPDYFFHIREDLNGNLWFNSTPPRVFRRRPDGSYPIDGEPLVAIASTGMQFIGADTGGVVWLGTHRGTYRYQPAENRERTVQPPPLIQHVDAGAASGDARTLRHDFRRLRVEFAPVSYRPGVMYQYRLDPVDAEWSAWTSEPFIDFTNLSGGDYTFRVRARGPATPPSGETRWSFAVEPPWYATPVATVFWIGLAAAVVVLIVRVRTNHLHGQADNLRASIAERTAELHEKNELLEQANARLERLSLVDEVTGVANRRYFQRALSEEWQRAARDNKPLALIMIDLDHFKDLNDRRGHPAGDDCLRQIGIYLASLIRRSGDVAARYGGEEFAILLVGSDEEKATQVAERLRAGIASLRIPYDESGSRTLTASCGVASLMPEGRETAESLIDHADRALYAAKDAGRDCVRVAARESATA